jgi:CspA family cold shock protein
MAFERITGTVRWYSAKGFGFIDPTGSTKESAIYFHLTDVNDHRILKAGDAVTFEIVQVPKGFKCVNVRATDTKEVKANVQSI